MMQLIKLCIINKYMLAAAGFNKRHPGHIVAKSPIPLRLSIGTKPPTI